MSCTVDNKELFIVIRSQEGDAPKLHGIISVIQLKTGDERLSRHPGLDWCTDQ